MTTAVRTPEQSTDTVTIAICHPADLRHVLLCAHQPYSRTCIAVGAGLILAGPGLRTWECTAETPQRQIVLITVRAEECYALQYHLRNEVDTVRLVWAAGEVAITRMDGTVIVFVPGQECSRVGAQP